MGLTTSRVIETQEMRFGGWEGGGGGGIRSHLFLQFVLRPFLCFVSSVCRVDHSPADFQKHPFKSLKQPTRRQDAKPQKSINHSHMQIQFPGSWPTAVRQLRPKPAYTDNNAHGCNPSGSTIQVITTAPPGTQPQPEIVDLRAQGRRLISMLIWCLSHDTSMPTL